MVFISTCISDDEVFDPGPSGIGAIPHGFRPAKLFTLLPDTPLYSLPVPCIQIEATPASHTDALVTSHKPLNFPNIGSDGHGVPNTT